MDKLTVTMEVERITKNTVRFKAIKENEFADADVETIYVQKSGLGKLKYEKGQLLVLTLETKDPEKEGDK